MLCATKVYNGHFPPFLAIFYYISFNYISKIFKRVYPLNVEGDYSPLALPNSLNLY
jgi:hypothetical protein